MTNEDETELHRLCDMLRLVDQSLAHDSPLREAVRKAGFGLSLAFIDGRRSKIEELALNIGKPLTEAQRQHLLSLGIDPDEP